MSEKFEITRLQTRAFRAKHLATGRLFELRGKQGVHYWTAHKVEKDVVNKNIYLDNWQSKKLLLEDLDNQIMREVAIAARERELLRAKLEAAKLAREKKGIERFRPEVYAELKRKAVNRVQTLLYAPQSQEKFTMFNNGKDGYRIEPFEGGQPICTGMGSEEEAILELYYYLDVDIRPETFQTYRDNCFRKRQS